MSEGRKSRSWSRTRSIDSDGERPKRKSKDLRRSVDYGRLSRRSEDASIQRFVLTDPIAFRYLEDDSSVIVLEYKREISGYQSYVVEQWATSRTHPTFTITTYTGDSSDRIIASVLGIPKDETTWSRKLKVYVRALNHFHARRRDTPDGIIMVTSLPGFPSSLTVIHVPDGDVSKHYADFFVNEDLKRLGCSGRVGLTLAYPNNATIAKYHQLYRTSERIALYSSVIELVRMCQMALHMFDLLENDFVDGLLCDVTEKAIVQWWTKFGSEVYSIEPHDGILGPSTVAGLLGLYCGARNRLHALAASVPKDAFDIEHMKRAVYHFQKAQKLQRTRRLDDKTLFKLHALTEKAANAEGWRIPRAVKTTVAELSGRGEEMVQEGTGRKTKVGIADVETTDIESFEQLVSGERCKWLWQGKALKRTNTAALGEASLDGLVAKSTAIPVDESQEKKKRYSEGDQIRALEEALGFKAIRTSLEESKPIRRHHTHRDGATKRAQGVFDEGRASIDRLRGAVTVHKRPLGSERTEAPLVSPIRPTHSSEPSKRPVPLRSHTSPVSSPRKISPLASSPGQNSEKSPVRTPLGRNMTSIEERRTSFTEQEIPTSLRRTCSEDLSSAKRHWMEDHSHIVQRRLSFSIAEGSMYLSEEHSPTLTKGDDLEQQFIQQRYLSQKLKVLREAIARLSKKEAKWTNIQIDALGSHLRQANEDQDVLREYYDSPAQAAQNLRDMATAVLRDEQEMLSEGKRELETLAAKLDYEIANLRGKIEDVELNVDDFERAVMVAEQRVDEVEREIEGKAGWSCVVS
ncbi:hypothetical protein BDZ85DRAFT_285328 [Elsinoe ampelina]|uniref:STB6-like N-terminal domain-containing protein n=1 Tax=Elsinoe ampelina TaxID=302913 RepID=A0A6A6G1J6_9PEZI|nr:hypothetical protein BDZ85DRAFT_285328 [Elsinoe ampelina]